MIQQGSRVGRKQSKGEHTVGKDTLVAHEHEPDGDPEPLGTVNDEAEVDVDEAEDDEVEEGDETDNSAGTVADAALDVVERRD